MSSASLRSVISRTMTREQLLAVELDNGSAHLTDADLAGFGAKTKFEVADVAGSRRASDNLVAPVEIDPKIHLRGSFAEDFVAGDSR